MPDHFVKLLGAQSVGFKIGRGDLVTLGRSAEADFIVDDGLVSRRHCSLEGSPAGLIVRDLASRNGTEVNGVRVQAAVVARPGDQIRIGRAHLLIDDASQTPARKTASLKADRDRERTGGTPATGAPADAAAFLPPIPGYDAVELLSSGACTLTYHARHRDRDVAVTLLRRGATLDQRTRFLRAAEALANLDHPNIARVADVCDERDRCFFVTTLIRGESLADAVERRPLGVRQALSVGVQIARALGLIHRDRIVHRDVRPETVMISRGGVAKLIGFGFVDDLDAGHGVAADGTSETLADPAFLAPEQIRDPREVGPRSDLYGLGATLFYAVTGQPPFTGTALGVVRRVLATPPRRLGSLLPGVSPLLEGAIEKLLTKEPSERFSGADDVMAALDYALLVACQNDPRDAPKRKPGPGRRRGITSTQSNPVVSSGQLGGGFSGLELLEIVQFLELNERNGRLSVRTADGDGELLLRAGVIASASLGEARGEAAARLLLAASSGTFGFEADAGISEGVPELRLRPAAVALDVVRTRDEEIHPRS